MHPDREPYIQSTISLYKADGTEIRKRLAELSAHGVKATAALLLRALVHQTPAVELMAYAVLLAKKYERDGWPSEPIAQRFPVKFSKSDLKKLDDVLLDLDRHGITEGRAFVVRSVVHQSPRGETLANLISRQLVEMPNKPRGLSAIRKG